MERNTVLFVVRRQREVPVAANQTAVTVRVFQGERSMAADNRLLGQVNLEGTPTAARGERKGVLPLRGLLAGVGGCTCPRSGGRQLLIYLKSHAKFRALQHRSRPSDAFIP